MMRTTLLCLVAHWRSRPGQLLMLALGLALATALWSGVQAINGEARASYARAADLLGEDGLQRLSRADGQPVAVATYVALRRAGYDVSPVLAGEMRGDGARLRLQGIDPLTAPGSSVDLMGGEDLDVASFFTEPGLLIMSPDTADGPLPPGLPPVVLSADVPAGVALTDISTAARLLGRQDPSYLLVAPNQPAGLAPLTDAADLVLGEADAALDVERLTDSFHLNLTAFGLLSFAVGLFIVHAAIGLAFEQRRAVFRTLRALGVPLGSLLTALALELGGIALTAGLLGVGLGYVIAAALMPGVAATLRGLYGAEVAGDLVFDPAWAAWALVITLLGAGIAGAQAMRRTARMPILAPAMPRAWAQASARAIRLQGAAALLLFLVSGVLVLLGEGLLAGFGVLAALLVGAALALPVLLNGVLRLGEHLALGAFWEWLLADTRQQVPGLSLALMALLLALATSVGVSTMVGSFRATFLGWLDQRIAAELYVTASDAATADAVSDWLAPRSDAVLPIVSAQTRIFDRPADVFGLEDHKTYRAHWPLLQGGTEAWDRLFAGDAVLINEQLARRQGLALGDLVPMTERLRLPVAGIYSDYGNPEGQAIVSFDLFSELFPEIPVTGFAVRVSPSDAPALASALREEFGLPDEAVRNDLEIKRFSLQVFERTFRVTGALSILTLGVAGLALLTSLLTLAGLRLPQLAPVWAVGLTRRQLAWVELARSLILAGVTWVLALPAGLLLAWVLLSVVNVEAFGWRLPMQVFPPDWMRLLLLSVLAAGLSAAWPALRLARMPAARLLQVFAQER